MLIQQQHSISQHFTPELNTIKTGTAAKEPQHLKVEVAD